MQNARKDTERPETDASRETGRPETDASGDAGPQTGTPETETPETAAEAETAGAGEPAGDSDRDAEAQPQDKLGALEAQLAETRDQMLRAVAEAENTRRRATREKEEAVKYAATGFARDILQIADNLDRALGAVSEELRRSSDTARTVIEGVEMTRRELANTFERHGIARIEALGQPFDAEKHQAMYEVESDEHAPGTVAQEMVPGYLLKDRLLRPAMVGVAKAPAGAGQQPPAGDARQDAGGAESAGSGADSAGEED